MRTNPSILELSLRLEKVALALVAKRKKHKKRKDYAGSPADGLDVTPGVGGDAGAGGDGAGGGGGP